MNSSRTLSTLKHDYSPNAKIYWDLDLNSVRCEWLNLYGELDELKKISKAAVELAKDNNTNMFIVDSYESNGAFPPEFVDYIRDELTPFAFACGIKFLMTILPKELGLASMATKRWQKEERSGMTLVNFKTHEDCADWIIQNK